MHCSGDAGFLIRCCNYMRKMAFYEWEGETRTAQMPWQIFCEWEGRGTHSANAAVTFLWMGGLRISLRKRVTRISWMEEWEAFRHKGNVEEDYMNGAALRLAPCCLFMYTNPLIHSGRPSLSPAIQMSILPFTRLCEHIRTIANWNAKCRKY